jgi:hypothetical protein
VPAPLSHRQYLPRVLRIKLHRIPLDVDWTAPPAAPGPPATAEPERSGSNAGMQARRSGLCCGLGQGEQAAEFGGSGRVAVGHPGDPAGQVGGEVGVALAVRRVEAVGGRVVQDGSQAVVLVARGGRVGVDDQAGRELTIGPVADPRLAGVGAESLVDGDFAYASKEFSVWRWLSSPAKARSSAYRA